MTLESRPDDPRPAPPRLVVFSDDWGRHPSSCQHLVSRLLDRFDVLWVDTIGTRTPGLDLATLRRGAGKLTAWRPRRRGAAVVGGEAAPEVLAPLMWPRFRRPLERRLNARLLERAVSRRLHAARPSIAVTTIPLVADLVGRLPVERWVYYCVDDLAAWPGLDGSTLEEMERRLVARVDDIVVVSDSLGERMASLGRESTRLTHGVDIERWRQPGPVPPEGLDRLERPLIVFWGVIDRRLDTEWIRQLSVVLEKGTILLVGPSDRPDPEVETLRRVERAGPMPFELLPALAGQASVLVMPYAASRATRAMQPLKLKEYLATGLPVIASRLPATEEWDDACDLVGDGASFARAVRTRLETGAPAEQLRARRRLEAEAWERKAERFADLLLGGGSGR